MDRLVRGPTGPNRSEIWNFFLVLVRSQILKFFTVLIRFGPSFRNSSWSWSGLVPGLEFSSVLVRFGPGPTGFGPRIPDHIVGFRPPEMHKPPSNERNWPETCATVNLNLSKIELSIWNQAGEKFWILWNENWQFEYLSKWNHFIRLNITRIL